MELLVKTLTPLWTGGVNTKMDRIFETGVIGSLRWWMEAFVRGLGGLVNDPTQNERSGFDPKKYDASTALDKRTRLRDAGLCDVSQVFGATGWRRRFRLDIQDTTSPDNTVKERIQAQRSYTDNNNQKHTPNWYFPKEPRSGQFTIHIQSMAQDFRPEVLAGLIQFVADQAAIGAKAQMGFGVIEPVNGRIETQALYDWLSATAGSQLYPTLPSLQNIFLAQIKPKDKSSTFTEQTIFNLKYDLRRLFANDQNLRHFIMGAVKDERIAAKVKMSWPYGDGVMRVWGWIPEQATVYRNGWNRNTVLNSIYQHLKANYSVLVWREMNSPQDTDTPNTSEPKVFLHSLLGLKEDGDAA